MTGVDRRFPCSLYTLLQNQLTRVPLLDKIMVSECSRASKSTDHSLYTLQGLILEAIGRCSQLLEAANNPNLQLTMDQIGDAVETAITLLANAANKTLLMRRTKILEEYNKKLQLHLFADDCLLYRVINAEQDTFPLQQDLDLLSNWAETWQLKFNIINVLYCDSLGLHHHSYLIINSTIKSYPLQINILILAYYWTRN